MNVEESTETSKCSDDNEPEMQKIQITAKALTERLDLLHSLRKLNKAHKIIQTVKMLMHNDQEYESEVQKCFVFCFKVVCLQACEVHKSLLILLPEGDTEKHDIWYKAKMIFINEFTEL